MTSAKLRKLPRRAVKPERLPHSTHISDCQASKVLDFAWWSIACRKYGIAAVVTDQLTFAETVAHEAVVAEVVALGDTDGYGAAIGPLYSDCERCVRLLRRGRVRPPPS